ncbi:MAG: VOC family protein [Methanocorpusculum sp.]|nr:VOC family protein [Methanocorpusculum sp.]
MKFNSALIVVEDVKRSKKFYTEFLGQKIENDFGENVAFEGGFCIQEKKLWREFVHKSDSEILFRGNDAELYFTEDLIDDFLERLNSSGAEIVCPLTEYNWGQRAVRFYDPDGHIIEVGESIEFVCRRMLSKGMSVDEVGEKSQMGSEYVRGLI